MSGWDIDKQYGTSAGHMRIEVGCGSQLSELDGTASGTESHAVATNLTYVAGGWVLCVSTSGAVQGVHITGGCISSQMVPTDHTWGAGFVDFTMDESSEGKDYYILFGY